MTRYLGDAERITWRALHVRLSMVRKQLDEVMLLMQTAGDGTQPFCPMDEWERAWALLRTVDTALDGLTYRFYPQPERRGEDYVYRAPFAQ